MRRSLRGLIAGCAMAAALLLGPASAAASPALGITPDVPSSRQVWASAATTARRLPYEGGQVLHSNRTHLIFWQPSGSGMTFDPGYVGVIESFMANVSAASHSPTNVFGLTGQYTDRGGPAAYASLYGSSVMDTDSLPPSECAEPPVVGPGWTVCLTDNQLQTEIQRVVSDHHLPTGPDDIYFLITPRGLGSCMDSGPSDCALGGSQSGYCGYHSFTSDGVLRYAVIPFNAVSGHCQSGNPRPNRSTADPALSTISHELNETVTDPYGDAWVNGSGKEDGDLCITHFGSAVGGSGTGQYNEVIHGGHYYLQEEWSNASDACRPRAAVDTAFFGVRHRFRRKRMLSLAGSGTDPLGRIIVYRWTFGDGHAGFGPRVRHRFPRHDRYTVILRATDNWRNWAFFTRRVRV